MASLVIFPYLTFLDFPTSLWPSLDLFCCFHLELVYLGDRGAGRYRMGNGDGYMSVTSIFWGQDLLSLSSYGTWDGMGWAMSYATINLCCVWVYGMYV